MADGLKALAWVDIAKCGAYKVWNVTLDFLKLQNKSNKNQSHGFSLPIQFEVIFIDLQILCKNSSS